MPEPYGERPDLPPDPLKLTVSEAERREAEKNRKPDEHEVSTDPDKDVQGLAPESVPATAAAPIPAVRWPANDANAPDYSHVAEIAVGGAEPFDLRPDDIDTLINLNSFVPAGENDTLTLAIRGSTLDSGHEQENVATARIKDVRPDHQNFRCLLGFYFRDRKRLTLFSGSTVPCPRYMENFYRTENNIPPFNGNIACNMLPNGCYVFRVAWHDGGAIKPALRMSDPSNPANDGQATVLRTKNDLTYGNLDVWDDPGLYYDNVHCAYFTDFAPAYRAHFSSAGCLTVRGEKTPSHQWKKFQAVLDTLGQGSRTDLILLTGKELAIASRLRTGGDASAFGDLRRLRLGSGGEAVKRLQRRLNVGQVTGYLGPSTRKRLTLVQKQKNVPVDGIFTPALDAAWEWGVFDPPVA